jgi:hypothetical protein
MAWVRAKIPVPMIPDEDLMIFLGTCSGRSYETQGSAFEHLTAHSLWNKLVAGRAKFTDYTLIFRLDAGKELRTSSEGALFC